MLSSGTPTFDSWIIGYGNPQRRDDGIGPNIVKRLQPLLGHRSDVHLLVLHQLEPDVIDSLKNAHAILFVDASVEKLAEGRRWDVIQPEIKSLPCLIHQVTPPFILGLLQCLYGRNPSAWMVSVEGNDFNFGSGLSSGAQKRSEQVIGEIAEFVLTAAMEKDTITLGSLTSRILEPFSPPTLEKNLIF
jgi:hydrogenase maturation protease